MTLFEIEAFLAIVQYGTLTKAAESIHISQPAISKRIVQLEDKLGYQLIIREKGIRKIRLTEKGNAFVPIANQMRNFWNDIKSQNEDKSYDVFRIASSDGPHLFILPRVYKKLKKLHVDLFLRLCTLNYHECYQRVANGSINIALVGANYYYKNVTSLPAYSEDMHFICRKDSDYPEIVDPKTLSISNTIYSPYSAEYSIWFNHWFRTQNKAFIESDLILQVEDFMTSFHKNMWTIVPTSVMVQFVKNPLLTTRKLLNEPPGRNIYFISRVGDNSEYIHTFLDLLRETILNMENIKLLLPKEIHY